MSDLPAYQVSDIHNLFDAYKRLCAEHHDLLRRHAALLRVLSQVRAAIEPENVEPATASKQPTKIRKTLS